MAGSLLSAEISPSLLVEWIGGGITAVFLCWVLVAVNETLTGNWQQRTVTGMAVGNGLLISLKLSPRTEIASLLAEHFSVVPSTFPAVIDAMLTIEMVIVLFYGFFLMIEGGGKFAASSFILALVGGYALPYSYRIGFLSVGFSWLMMELSSADRW